MTAAQSPLQRQMSMKGWWMGTGAESDLECYFQGRDLTTLEVAFNWLIQINLTQTRHHHVTLGCFRILIDYLIWTSLGHHEGYLAPIKKLVNQNKFYNIHQKNVMGTFAFLTKIRFIQLWKITYFILGKKNKSISINNKSMLF